LDRSISKPFKMKLHVKKAPSALSIAD